MTIRVLVNGAQGKMGRLAVKTLSQQKEFTLVGATGRQDDLATEINTSRAQVVVDLTNADAVFKNAQTIINANAHPVIGTSGLLKKDVEDLQNQCKTHKIGGLIVPNFSLGAVLLMKHAQEIVKYFPQVEIIEMHHQGKLDSPSGTAIRTAEMLAQTRTLLGTKSKPTRETLPGSRGAVYQDIPIHAIRLPGMMAHLQVIFGNSGESLSLKHDTLDRECYMPGLLLACKKAFELNELIYGLENVL